MLIVSSMDRGEYPLASFSLCSAEERTRTRWMPRVAQVMFDQLLTFSDKREPSCNFWISPNLHWTFSFMLLLCCWTFTLPPGIGRLFGQFDNVKGQQKKSKRMGISDLNHRVWCGWLNFVNSIPCRRAAQGITGEIWGILKMCPNTIYT
jgi:hypothetical protein